jgi:hypothetical protein
METQRELETFNKIDLRSKDLEPTTGRQANHALPNLRVLSYLVSPHLLKV